VVEDNPITRRMLRLALESDGHRVLEAADGRTALEAVARRRPDVLVLDYILPDTDGLALLAEIRSRAGAAELPAIVVSGLVARLEALRTLAGPGTQFLTKPVEPSRLLEAVQAALGHASLPRSGRRVLVVDDDPVNRKLAELWLRQAGYEVETASSGAEGLSQARRHSPDAILADVLMPSMDGFSFCGEARLDPSLASVPVVLVSSAYVEDGDRELAARMGAVRLVARTPDLDEAVAAIDEALRTPSLVEPPSSDPALAVLHRQRVQNQLERHAAQNVALIRQAAIQASALTVMRGLSDVLAEPHDVLRVVAGVLIQCLDAAGLSTGLLYVVTPQSLRLVAQCGVPVDRRLDADVGFGHAELLRRIVDASEPMAASIASTTDPAVHALLERLGHRSVLVVPFAVEGRGLGAVVLASDAQDLTDDAWLRFARTIALQFSRTVALGHSLGRLRQLAEHLKEVFWLTDAGFTEVLYVSSAFEQVFGHSRESLYRRPGLWREAIHPDDRAHLKHLAGDAGEVDETCRIVRGDGSVRWIRVRSVPIVGEDGRVHRRAGIAEDVTEVKRAEEERQRLDREASAAQERLRALSRRVVRLQEEERRMLARELHDEAGQILVAVKFMVETVERQEADVDLRPIKESAGQLVDRLRDLSLNLRPPMLDDFGLVPSLLWQFERYRAQTAIEVRFQHGGIEHRLPPETEIAAFRIIQEALTNVGRHAAVTEVRVDLRLEDETLKIRIEDKGRGFDPAASADSASGLAGMRERAALAGGSLAIDSRPGEGTRVEADLPADGGVAGGARASV
jgi:PAS domain S-box-containing protein